MEFILAQVLGFIALILVCIGYFLKDRFKFLLIQVIANFFYACAFLVVEAYVGGIIIFISLIRCLYIYIAEKYSFKYIYHFLPIFIILYIITTILLWSSWLDLMPLFASSIFTVGFAIKNLQKGKFVLIIPNVILVIYNIFTTTYTSALLDFIEVVVIVIAIIKFYIDKKKNKEKIEVV